MTIAREATARPRIDTALIGYGRWGPELARNAGELRGCRLAAICDVEDERLRAARHAFPEAALASDWKSTLTDPRIRAVIVATPAHTHHAIALAALRAGKHVLVEKPFANSVAEAKELLTESIARQRVLMVDHTYLYSPAVAAIRKLLADDVIGRLRHVESWRLNRDGVRSDAPVHWDLASHDLSILQHVFAEAPIELTASAQRGDDGSPHAVDLGLAYEGDLSVDIHVSWIAPGKSRRMVFVGTKATLVYDDLEPARKLELCDSSGGHVWSPDLDACEPLNAALHHFVECIDAGRLPLSDGRAGLAVVQLLEAADASLAGDGARVLVGNVGAYA